MNQRNTSLVYFLIIVFLIGVIFFMSRCADKCVKNLPENAEADTVTIVNTRIIPGDSVPYPVYVGQPRPDTILQSDTLIINLTDSAALAALKDYYSTRVYDHTVKNDSDALIVVRDFVRKNRVSSRLVTYQNRRESKETIITKTVPEAQKIHCYIGGVVGYSPSGKIAAGPSVLITLPRGLAVGYQWDAVGNTHQAGVYFRLK